MNRQQEQHLLALAKTGDMAARSTLIENLMHQVKYIAKDYVNKGLDWDDILQEGKIGLIKAVDYILKLEDFDVRVITYAKKKIRDSIRSAFYQFGNTIRQPRSYIKKQRLLAASNSLFAAVIQETNYNNTLDDGPTIWSDPADLQDNWNRLTLHDKLIEIIDVYLTNQEKDIVQLKFGFGHDYFDTPDWQKPNKALTLKQISEVTDMSAKNVKMHLHNAMEKLQQEEVKYQLLEWRRY